MSRIQAVIFDWAGTMIDFGSFAPMGVFVEAFRKFGVEATIEEARAPMGMPKWDHINAMLAEPRLAGEWEKAQGTAPGKADVDRVYEVFVPMNEAVVADYATLVPGARDMLDWLDARGIKVGSTTGYTRFDHGARCACRGRAGLHAAQHGLCRRPAGRAARATGDVPVFH
jgi:phosphonoacetaldehyde hydrolase